MRRDGCEQLLELLRRHGAGMRASVGEDERGCAIDVQFVAQGHVAIQRIVALGRPGIDTLEHLVRPRFRTVRRAPDSERMFVGVRMK